MKRFVITIGREFGCNASEVGRKLAAMLGVRFYGKELVDLAAQRAGVDDSTLFNPDRKESERDRLSRFAEEFGYGASSSFFSEKAIEAQASVIREIANRESCVMFGRCADYFLAEFDTTLNLFLYAPDAFRIQHVCDAYKLDPLEAERLIKKIDKKRHDYYKCITGKNRGDRHGRNLMIDMQMFDVDAAVDLSYHAACERFSL